MKYYVTYRQFSDKSAPLLLTKSVPNSEKLKFYIDLIESSADLFELISIVPIKEG